MVCHSQDDLRGKETLKTIITSISFIDILPALWTIAGNAICIFTFVKTRALHTPSNVLVGALCATDLYTGLIIQPLFISICFNISSHNDISNLVGITTIAVHFGGVASFCLTYLVTLDRYIAICHPFRYQESVTAKRYFCAVIITILATAMMTILEEYYRHEVYIFNLALQAVVIPQMIIFYASIYKIIRRQRKAQISVGTIEGCDTNSTEVRQQKKEKKRAYTIGIIIIVFVVCYAPQMVSYLFIFKVQDGFCHLSSYAFTVSICLQMLVLLNSAVNPIVYSLRMKAIRKAACRLFKRNTSVIQRPAIEHES